MLELSPGEDLKTSRFGMRKRCPRHYNMAPGRGQEKERSGRRKRRSEQGKRRSEEKGEEEEGTVGSEGRNNQGRRCKMAEPRQPAE